MVCGKDYLVLSSVLRDVAPDERTAGGYFPSPGTEMKKGSAFAKRVIRVVAGIPKGSVMTYKEVATRAGSAKAARAVAPVLRRYFVECQVARRSTIPCHRVVRSDGTIGGYIYGEKKKRTLLKKEGAL